MGTLRYAMLGLIQRAPATVIASGRNGFDQKNRLHITSEDAEKPCLSIVKESAAFTETEPALTPASVL